MAAEYAPQWPFMDDRDLRVLVVTLSIVSEPFDVFVRHILRVDGQGRLLKDLVSKRVSPVRTMMADAFRFLSRRDGCAWEIGVRHFQMSAEEASGHWTVVRGQVLEVTRSAFYRCDLYYLDDPSLLIVLIANDRTEEEKSLRAHCFCRC